MRHITASTLDRAHVVAAMKQVRRSGSVLSLGELSEGAVAVAVPVFAGGEVVCALALAGPQSRCGKPWRVMARTALVDAGGRLTEVLELRVPAARPAGLGARA
ncbi:MAG: IclR family transcriptional regulator domain-containing protein [Streptosporangiaceae bacterium]